MRAAISTLIAGRCRIDARHSQTTVLRCTEVFSGRKAEAEAEIMRRGSYMTGKGPAPAAVSRKPICLARAIGLGLAPALKMERARETTRTLLGNFRGTSHECRNCGSRRTSKTKTKMILQTVPSDEIAFLSIP